MPDAPENDRPWRNEPIEPWAVPDYREVEFEPVAPAYYRYVTVTTVLFWILAAAIVAAAGLQSDSALLPGAWTPVAVAAAALLQWLYRLADARRRGRALRTHDILARAGVLWRSITALPIARIQHVETTHGPIERRFGLARLKLFTAGGMTADLVVPGLERGEADRLREFLVEQIHRRDSGGDPSDDA